MKQYTGMVIFLPPAFYEPCGARAYALRLLRSVFLSLLLVSAALRIFELQSPLKTASAQENSPASMLPSHSPKTCLGLTGRVDLEIPGRGIFWRCEPGHAVYAAYSFANRSFSPTNAILFGTCCPLPSSDILLDESIFSASHCPDGFVITGTQIAGDMLDPSLPRSLICTKVNSARYYLAPPQPPLYAGLTHTFWLQRPRILMEDIPIAIRFGVARFKFDEWGRAACIGKPFGSLFVAKSGGMCNYQARQLLFRGLAGDPSPGTPVQMYPDCDQISDLYHSDARCITYANWKRGIDFK